MSHFDRRIFPTFLWIFPLTRLNFVKKLHQRFIISFLFHFQKPHDLSNIVDTEEGSFLIMSQAPGSKSDDHTPHLIFTTMTSSGGGLHGDINTSGGLGSILMDESVSMDEFKMSPATDALEYLLNAASHVATTAGTDTTTTSTLQQNDDQVFDL